MTSFPAEADLPLVAALLRPGSDPLRVERPAELFARAEAHGLGGVLRERCLAAGLALPAELDAELARRALARQLDHDAHVAVLRRIDAALAERGLRAVVLKGPLFAERFYAEPSARGTSDIDLLVEEARLDDAVAALASTGYRVADEEHAAWSRREHHHILLTHPHALPLELHFHAYRGFGRTLPAAPLVAQARSAGEAYASLCVLAPEDELVYLAVHAAAHRFGRLAWLYDIALLLGTMSAADVARGRERARGFGFARALAMAGELVTDVLGVPADVTAALGVVAPARSAILRAVVGEPSSPVLRSATRFVYTALLADSVPASLRYVRAATMRHARELVGLAR